MEVTSIILAGGKNRRLGRDKALERIRGKSLLEGVIERLGPLSSQIMIVTSPEKSDLLAVAGVKVLADIYPGVGPLGAIYTGLLASQSSYSVVVACDMPFLNTVLLRYIIELAPDFDAVVPRLEEEKLEPLHAVYSRSCLNVIKTQLENNQFATYAFLDRVRVRYVEREECRRFDPQLLSFFNINYQADLDKAIALATEAAANDASPD